MRLDKRGMNKCICTQRSRLLAALICLVNCVCFGMIFQCSSRPMSMSLGSSVFVGAFPLSSIKGGGENREIIRMHKKRKIFSVLHYRSLGDIMSDESQDSDDLDHGGNESSDSCTKINGVGRMPTKKPSVSGGLVTSTGGNLQTQFGGKITNPPLSPMERIALTANGNLQRIFSSYYDAPVHVNVDHCVRRQGHKRNKNDDCYINGTNGESRDYHNNENDAIWDRVVYLSVFGKNFCKATSIITVHSSDCIRCVESGEVGIGQLFRHLDKLPTFNIIDAGRCTASNGDDMGNGGLWRRYTLGSKELTCDILEEFVPNAWEMQPLDNILSENENIL